MTPPPPHVIKGNLSRASSERLEQPHKDAPVDVFSEQVLLNIQVNMRGLQYAFSLITENTEA